MQDHQEKFFQIKVIGFIQSLVHTETAKILCNGIYKTIERNNELRTTAEQLKSFEGKCFYRTSQHDKNGLGFQSAISDFGHHTSDSFASKPVYLEYFLQTKEKQFNEIVDRFEKRNQSRYICTIL